MLFLTVTLRDCLLHSYARTHTHTHTQTNTLALPLQFHTQIHTHFRIPTLPPYSPPPFSHTLLRYHGEVEVPGLAVHPRHNRLLGRCRLSYVLATALAAKGGTHDGGYTRAVTLVRLHIRGRCVGHDDHYSDPSPDLSPDHNSDPEHSPDLNPLC